LVDKETLVNKLRLLLFLPIVRGSEGEGEDDSTSAGASTEQFTAGLTDDTYYSCGNFLAS